MNMHRHNIHGTNVTALNEEQIARIAPSVFAVAAHESRSERFTPIPTIEVLRGLQREGWSVVGVRQSRSRDESRREFTKHLVRMRRLDEAHALKKVGDTTFEALLKNANDGTSAYDLMAGLFRLVCMNGMVVSDGVIETVKVKHLGDVTAKVIEGTYRVLDQADAALEAPRQWSRVDLSADERLALASAARVLRFDEERSDNSITPDRFLLPRRTQDTGTDLWSTFNVIQENVIRGGLNGFRTDANNRQRRMQTRAINGIDQDVKLNKALWTLATEMAKLKSAA
jgi:hypothetical protein